MDRYRWIQWGILSAVAVAFLYGWASCTKGSLQNARAKTTKHLAISAKVDLQAIVDDLYYPPPHRVGTPGYPFCRSRQDLAVAAIGRFMATLKDTYAPSNAYTPGEPAYVVGAPTPEAGRIFLDPGTAAEGSRAPAITITGYFTDPYADGIQSRVYLVKLDHDPVSLFPPPISDPGPKVPAPVFDPLPSPREP